MNFTKFPVSVARSLSDDRAIRYVTYILQSPVAYAKSCAENDVIYTTGSEPTSGFVDNVAFTYRGLGNIRIISLISIARGRRQCTTFTVLRL